MEACSEAMEACSEAAQACTEVADRDWAGDHGEGAGKVRKAAPISGIP